MPCCQKLQRKLREKDRRTKQYFLKFFVNIKPEESSDLRKRWRKNHLTETLFRLNEKTLTFQARLFFLAFYSFLAI